MEDKYIKIYYSFYNIKINKAEWRLLLYLASLLKKGKSTILLDKNIISDFFNSTKEIKALSTVYRAIKTLKEKLVIIEYPKEIMLNPVFIFNGSENEREQELIRIRNIFQKQLDNTKQ